MQNDNTQTQDYIARMQYIKLLYKDILSSSIANNLIFKWWTSLVLFENLARFSEDLDFNVDDIAKLENIAKILHTFLKLKWYRVSDIHFDWTNLIHFEIYYEINKNTYACQIELWRFNYWLNVDFVQKRFQWKLAKVMTLEQNFAYKCCAYLERGDNKVERSWKPKWRDLFDIVFYLNKNILPDLKLLQARMNIQTHKELFQKMLKTFFLKHVKYYTDFKNEINFFTNNNNTWNQILNAFVELINKKYFNGVFSFETEVFWKIDEAQINKIIQVWENYFVKKNNDWLFELKYTDGEIIKTIYTTKDKIKLKENIANNFELYWWLK